MSDASTITGILAYRKPLTGGPAAVSVASSSVANPTVITTSAPHGLSSKDKTTIAGHTGSTPAIAGEHVVNVLSPTTFSIPVAVTVGGSGGTSTLGFQVIAEITEVGPGGMSRNKIETSTHNDGSESHVLGILRQSDPSLKINYVGSNLSHIAILSDLANNTKATWQFAFPSGKTRTGDAYVQKWDFDNAPVDGKQGASLAITWAGPVVEVAGA